MSYNPFGHGEDDNFDDIFEEDSHSEEFAVDDLEIPPHKHTFDGDECPTCKEIHPSNILDDFPGEARESILNFLDDVPDGFARVLIDGAGKRGTKKEEAETITAFLSFVERADNTKSVGPALMAVIEHLDEQTQGKITAKWKVYDVERRLILTHKIMKSVNIALDDVLMNDQENINLISILELLVEYAYDRLRFLTKHYKEVSSSIDYEPKEELIETGVYDAEERDVHTDLFKLLMAR